MRRDPPVSAPGALTDAPAPQRRAVLAVARGVALASAATALGCAGGASPGAGAPVAAQPAAEPAAEGGGWVRVLVRFVEPPVAERFAPLHVPDPDGARRAAIQAYAEQLRAAQKPRVAAIESLGGRVENTLTHSANAALVALPAARAAALIEALRGLPGVAGVQPAGVYRADPAPPASSAPTGGGSR
jgi:hypothetical protein